MEKFLTRTALDSTLLKRMIKGFIVVAVNVRAGRIIVVNTVFHIISDTEFSSFLSL